MTEASLNGEARSAPKPGPATASGFRRLPIAAWMNLVAVRWYLRHGRSYRDVEELPQERAVEVDHVRVFGSELGHPLIG